MAKSLRSKWKRKMRAVKRDKNDKRVLAKLKETIKNTKVVMTEDMVRFKERDELLQKERTDKLKSETSDTMQMDKKRLTLTLEDENGNQPVWLHKRQAKRLKRTKKMKKRLRKSYKKRHKNNL